MGGAEGFLSRSLGEQGGDDGRLWQDDAADFIGLGREPPVDSGAALEADAIGDCCRDGDLDFFCDCRDHGKPIVIDERSIRRSLDLMEILGSDLGVWSDKKFSRSE